MKSSVLLCVGAVVGVLTSPLAEKAMEIEVTRKTVTSKSGTIPEYLGRSLFWFGQFVVGESKNLSLLIDTGSLNLYVDEGLYKPSKHEKKFPGSDHFSAGYEGVSRAGFGFEQVNGTLHIDTVTGGGLTVANQTIGAIETFKFYDLAHKPHTAIPGDGIIGFQGSLKRSDALLNSWFFNLCIYKGVSACRLGLAYGTSGKGMALVGKFAKRLTKGPLVTVPMIDQGYVVSGDVYLNGELVNPDQIFILDEGTDNIQSPLGIAQDIFKKLGYPTSLREGSAGPFSKQTVKVLQGFFPCNKPPTLGFAFPPKSKLKKGQESTIFNVSTTPGIWDVYDHGNNNCTSILGGTSNQDDKVWLLGQPFFAGHYVDFNNDDFTIGFGVLKSPVNPNM